MYVSHKAGRCIVSFWQYSIVLVVHRADGEDVGAHELLDILFCPNFVNRRPFSTRRRTPHPEGPAHSLQTVIFVSSATRAVYDRLYTC
ncbi:hypothetical protein BKA63DRAFT_527377 [Paraphoma chrysanthemicola]|nr:hypothetical protein BKA63DRAFT_527377 [Paraphoma chrysanthemicola]